MSTFYDFLHISMLNLFLFFIVNKIFNYLRNQYENTHNPFLFTALEISKLNYLCYRNVWRKKCLQIYWRTRTFSFLDGKMVCSTRNYATKKSKWRNRTIQPGLLNSFCKIAIKSRIWFSAHLSAMLTIYLVYQSHMLHYFCIDELLHIKCINYHDSYHLIIVTLLSTHMCYLAFQQTQG